MHLLECIKPFIDSIVSGKITENDGEKFKYYLSFMKNKAFDEIFDCLKDLVKNKFSMMDAVKSPSKTESLKYRVAEAIFSLGRREHREFVESLSVLHDCYYIGLSFKAGLYTLSPEQLYEKYKGFAKKNKTKNEILSLFEDFSTNEFYYENLNFDIRWLKVLSEDDHGYKYAGFTKYILKRVDYEEVYPILSDLYDWKFEKFGEIVVDFVTHICLTYDRSSVYDDRCKLLSFIGIIDKGSALQIKYVVSFCENESIKKIFTDKISEIWGE
jgi:hypothetical protein